MATTHLNKEDFIDKVTNLDSSYEKLDFKGQRPAVIDFYAEWCSPCKMLAPILEEVSDEYKGKVDFYKVNVDDENELAAHFAIHSIPTLMFIPMNGKPQRSQGAMGKPQLKEAIERILLK